MDDQSDIAKLAHLIKDIKVAMLATIDEEGNLRSRPMATLRTLFDGDLWFFTSASSYKVRELKRDARVNLSYANPDDSIYVSVTGTSTLMQDREKVKELWSPLMKSWFPRGLEDPDLALLKVRVEQAEYWDSPSGVAVTMSGFARAIASGQRYQPDPREHG